MIPNIFTDFRRELIARTLFDILKVAVAATLASKFFAEFSDVVKWLMWLAIVVLAVAGTLFCPLEKPKG